MSLPFPLVILLGLASFSAFWCLALWLSSRLTAWLGWGWQRLVPDFGVTHWPPGRSFRVGQLYVGACGYKGIVTAEVSPAGLLLRVLFLFRIGTPPLLIPWAALGELTATTFLWSTSYATSIRTRVGEGVPLKFNSQPLSEAIVAARPGAPGANTPWAVPLHP